MNIDEPVQGAFVLPGRRNKHRRPSSQHSNRMPLIKLLPKTVRGHFVAMCGEFTGTFLFLFFAFSGTQVANNSSELSPTPNPAQLLYISLSFGFSLAANAWVFFRISGGLFNPAVTFGMCFVGALPYTRGSLLVISQIVGAIASAAVVTALFPGPLNVRTQLNAETSVTQGLFIEMFLTAQLVFTIFMLAAEKHKATFIAPIGIGLSLFVAELSGVYYTGGSLNPARSFAPCVVLGQFRHYHWIYWVGPLLGTLLASGFYIFMKMLEYETANPGQDSDDEDHEHFDPVRDAEHTHTSGFKNDDQSDVSHPVKTTSEQNQTRSDAAAASTSHAGNSATTNGKKPAGNSSTKNGTMVTKDEVLSDAFKQGPFAEAGLVSDNIGSHQGPKTVMV